MRDFTPFGLSLVPRWVEAALSSERPTVVLATGDPLCRGVGRYLLEKLGHERCVVLPNVSTLQLAFARLGLAWHTATLASVHGRDAGEWDESADSRHGLSPLLAQIRQTSLLGVFTSEKNSPDRIARMLDRLGLGEVYEIAVAERLLQPDERIIGFESAAEVGKRSFAHPNVAVIRRVGGTVPAAIRFGLVDDAYAQRQPEQGLITKREVRAVTLAYLGLRPDSIVWDIGAGSGSVGLEAASLCPSGFVYAAEKNEADVAVVRQNQRAHAVTNYKVQHGRALELLSAWPDPDAVFIGGSGGQLRELIRDSWARLHSGGALVLNLVTFENLALAMECLRDEGALSHVCQLQVARSRKLLDLHRLEPLSPVWIVSARKEAA